MKSSSEYRALALNVLSGNWTAPVLFTLVLIVVSGICSGLMSFVPVVGGLVAAFLLTPASWAYQATILRNYRGGDEFEISGLLEGYQNDFQRLFTTLGLKLIYVYLWTLLLIIPGIIKAYAYAMTEFILEDDDEVSNNEAIERSMQMMEGHKMELFLLDLSFIGWYILSILTLGIGFLWLSPYMKSARAAFYEDLKNSQNSAL